MKRSITNLFLLACGCAVIQATGTAFAAPTTFSASGANPAAIQATVDNFRNALGALNAPNPVQNADGRRQINWDAAPAAVSAPNAFPGGFFNFGAFPRARGIAFTTPGTGFQLSGDVDDTTPIRFENLNPTYLDEFQTFSAERLFTPLGSNQVEANFFSPVDQVTAALSDGFGAVFTDVDTLGSTMLEFRDVDGNILQTEIVPVADKGLSFVGVKFDSNILASVSITSGNAAVGPTESSSVDIVVMDDFIFGEPTVVPEPTTLLLALMGATALISRRRRRHK